MKPLYSKFVFYSENYLKDIVLLALRVLLAYAFLHPALEKWADIDSVIQWFEYLGIPLAGVNAYMAATVEIVGVFLLVLGLGTRIISLPLIVTMLVAIATVHGQNGWLVIASSKLNPVAGENLATAKNILKEYGDYKNLTSQGNFVILQNGMEFVVSYIVMLLALVSFGSGRISLDAIISKFQQNK